jgi:hypothetical protein
MANKKGKRKTKRDLWYNIFYIAAFAAIGIIGLFGNSFFAYDIFDSLFFHILNLLLTVALFVVRSIQTFLRQTALYGKIFTLSYYNLFASVFALRPFVTGRLWAALLFGGFIAAIVLLIILAFKYTNASGYVITKFEALVAVIPLILLLAFASKQNYIEASQMWVPIVAAGVILAAAALYAVLKFFKNIPYFKQERKSELVFASIIMVMVCFCVSGTAVTTANYAFDNNPTSASFEIIDKRIQSGARQITAFYLKVNLDGQEKEIDVPIDIYHSKEVGDGIEIKFYTGALGYGYYMYEYIGES